MSKRMHGYVWRVDTAFGKPLSICVAKKPKILDLMSKMSIDMSSVLCL